MEELKKFMELSKLQNPTRRNKPKEEEPWTVKKVETVKQLDDGTVSITKMEIKPTSSGREIWHGNQDMAKVPL